MVCINTAQAARACIMWSFGSERSEGLGPGFLCELALMGELVMLIDSPSIWANSALRGQQRARQGIKDNGQAPGSWQLLIYYCPFLMQLSCPLHLLPRLLLLC